LYGSSLTLLTAAPKCAGSPVLCLGRPSWERPSTPVAEFTHTHSADDGGGLCDEMRPRKNVWRGAFMSFEAGIEVTKN
jgi:hypothetical protein